MVKYLLIALGGAIGTILRYYFSNIDYKYSVGVFPFGTFIVNITGSFLIGFLWGLSERVIFPSKLRMFTFVGILGGYTTFSTFGLESFNLLRDGEYHSAISNILLTNIVGILFVFLGYFLSQVLVNTFHKGG